MSEAAVSLERPQPATVPVFSVGLEEAADGSVRVHALDLLGCAAEGSTRDEALAAFELTLGEWLGFLDSVGEAVPPPEAELQIVVDEWVRTGADVGAGESDVLFAADLRPLSTEEIDAGVRRLGDLRGVLLRELRRLREAELDAAAGGWSARRILDELARAQWWTLTRLGASPLAEVPARTLGRLDTALALVVDRFTALEPALRTAVLEIEGETWTPRKVLRRLLWLEWSLGRAARHALTKRTGA